MKVQKETAEDSTVQVIGGRKNSTYLQAKTFLTLPIEEGSTWSARVGLLGGRGIPAASCRILKGKAYVLV